MDIKEAVLQASQGDKEAYKYLYRSTYAANYKVALNYTKDEQKAKEVLQVAYNKAFRNLKMLKNPEKFEDWMRRIVEKVATSEQFANASTSLSVETKKEIEKEDASDQFVEIEDEEESPQLKFIRLYKKVMVACIVVAMVGTLTTSLVVNAMEVKRRNERREQKAAEANSVVVTYSDNYDDALDTSDNYETLSDAENTEIVLDDNYYDESEATSNYSDSGDIYTNFEIHIDEPVAPNFVSSDSLGVLYKDILFYAKNDMFAEDDGYSNDGIIARNLSTGEEMLLFSNGYSKGFTNLELYGNYLYFSDEASDIYKLNAETGYVEYLPDFENIINNSGVYEWKNYWLPDFGFVIFDEKLYFVTIPDESAESDAATLMSYDLNNGQINFEGDLYTWRFNIGPHSTEPIDPNRIYANNNLIYLDGTLYFRGYDEEKSTDDGLTLTNIYSSFLYSIPYGDSPRVEDPSILESYFPTEELLSGGYFEKSIYKIGTIQGEYQGYICLGKTYDDSNTILVYSNGNRGEVLLKQW